jgi:hypothetical protein
MEKLKLRVQVSRRGPGQLPGPLIGDKIEGSPSVSNFPTPQDILG